MKDIPCLFLNALGMPGRSAAPAIVATKRKVTAYATIFLISNTSLITKVQAYREWPLYYHIPSLLSINIPKNISLYFIPGGVFFLLAWWRNAIKGRHCHSYPDQAAADER
jgi:hypothetical protein